MRALICVISTSVYRQEKLKERRVQKVENCWIQRKESLTTNEHGSAFTPYQAFLVPFVLWCNVIQGMLKAN